MSVRRWTLLAVMLALLSAICLAALSVTIWWARTTVRTAETQLWVERQSVEALGTLTKPHSLGR